MSQPQSTQGQPQTAQGQQSQPSQSTQGQPQQPTAQEILQALEREYQDRNKELAGLKDSLTKSQESVIAAQDAAFKAFQILSANKERYLVNLIGQAQGQLNSQVQENSKLKQLLLQQLQKNSLSQNTPPVPATSVVPTPQLPTREDNLSTVTNVAQPTTQ